MKLIEKILDRKGYKRERTLNSMKVNKYLKIGDVVKVAETGYFYDIQMTGAFALDNGLKAGIRRTTLLGILLDHIVLLASDTSNGHMSKDDKLKLDNIATDANNYIHPTTSGNKHIPIGGNLKQILINNGDGDVTWGNSVDDLQVTSTFTLQGYTVGIEE